MYRLMRDTHLVLGVVFTLFLLMYGLSAVQMAHPDAFPMEPTTTERRIELGTAPAPAGPEALAHRLGREHGLRGDLDATTATDEGYDLRIVRPGTVYEVRYARATGTALVRTHTATFLGMLNRLHHVGGLWHDYVLIDVWGVLVGVVSVGLILLGLSGLYLWFRTYRERAIGGVLLAFSIVVSLTLILLIRTAR